MALKESTYFNLKVSKIKFSNNVHQLISFDLDEVGFEPKTAFFNYDIGRIIRGEASNLNISICPYESFHLGKPYKKRSNV